MMTKVNIFVVQMGKVGSRSVQLALLEAGVNAGHKHGLHRISDPDGTEKIITPVRDIVARNFSGFFASLKNFVPYEDWDTFTVEQYVDVFVNEYPHDGYLDWLERKIDIPLNVSIYDHPFDPEKGYIIIDRLLLFRIEDFDEKGNQILKEFLGDAVNIKPRRSNVLGTIHKAAGPHYARVKEAHAMPEEFLDKMYSSKYSTHFYSDAEIEGFRKIWGK